MDRGRIFDPKDISSGHGATSRILAAIELWGQLLTVKARAEDEGIEETRGACQGSTSRNCGKVRKSDEARGIERHAREGCMDPGGIRRGWRARSFLLLISAMEVEREFDDLPASALGGSS